LSAVRAANSWRNGASSPPPPPNAESAIRAADPTCRAKPSCMDQGEVSALLHPRRHKSESLAAENRVMVASQTVFRWGWMKAKAVFSAEKQCGRAQGSTAPWRAAGIDLSIHAPVMGGGGGGGGGWRVTTRKSPPGAWWARTGPAERCLVWRCRPGSFATCHFVPEAYRGEIKSASR